MPTYDHGRHEHGQNFLIDPRTIDQLVGLVRQTAGPIVEIGPGDGALTLPLATLGRPVTAVEIDAGWAERLAARLPSHARVVRADFLSYRLPCDPHVVVANVPFHLTTAILRRLLRAPGWTEAVLLLQWEVARRRAGVGGASMMTAQWAPWFSFELHGRVPAAAFRPRPAVDGGVLVIRRRGVPLLSVQERGRFQAMVHAVYTSRGRGVVQMVRRAGSLTSASAAAWAARNHLRPTALPRDLPPGAWIDLFAAGSPRQGEPQRMGR